MRKCWNLGFGRRYKRVPDASPSTEAAVELASSQAELLEDTATAVAGQAGGEPSKVAGDGYAAVAKDQIIRFSSAARSKRTRGKPNGR